MTNKTLCQLGLRDCLYYRGQQKTLACNYHVKCHGRFFFLFFFIDPWIFKKGYLPRESAVTHANRISRGQRVITAVTAVKLSRVAAPIKLTPGLRKMYIAIK